MSNSIFTLLQVADSIFPIGAYTQSNGLETYVQKGIVKDKESAKEYLHNMLWYGAMYNDALALKLSYEYTLDKNIEKIAELDEMFCALKAPREIKQGSIKMCGRFLKVVEKFEEKAVLSEYKRLIKSGLCLGQHSIVFGIFSAEYNIEKNQALSAYLYNLASCIVNNCAKLIPLGQIEGQTILFESRNLLEKILVKLDSLTETDFGRCTIGFDIRAMQHENLYSRLYMS
ncbi:MAG: urease accessory protein UreF [Bacillota bacterium]|nr:urease accessory protein UreF [Bacillota bacterium]